MKKLLHAASSASRLAAFVAFSLGSAAAQTPQSTDGMSPAGNPDEPQHLAAFEVTGSRIKRLDYETPSPVAVYSADDISAKGYLNLGDFIQSLPFNAGTENSIYQSGSFMRGAATANLRGLGSQRFLVLLDGRRTAPYALPSSSNRSYFDFNSLPVAAIDHIELQKDGASAIYGADAITGVLNIKLKKNFSGVTVSAYYGNTLKNSGGDTGTVEFSAVAGAGNASTSVMTALDVKTANSNFVHDYGVTNTDYSYLGTNKGLNQNSSFNWPANLTLTKAQATSLKLPYPANSASSWTYVVQGGQPTATPALANFAPAPASSSNPNAVLLGNENRYNFAPTLEIYPSYDYINDFTTLEHAFTDSLKAFAEITYSRNLTYYAYTPGVIYYPFEGLTLPANNPNNPFGIPLTSLMARANFGPTRKFDMDALSAELVGGLRGTVANRWDWETAVEYGFSDVTMVWRNAMLDATYQAALNGTLAGFTGKFLNPFGPSDADLTKALFTDSTNNNRASELSWDGHVSGRLFTLPAGDVGLAVGGEVRDEKLVARPDTTVYIAGGGGAPLTGKRTVTAEYAEITAPVYKSATAGSAEIQLAARHEHYSDFGDTTKPKVGVSVRLPKNHFLNVLLRGSYSESFQAPALGLEYSTQTIGYSNTVLQDPLRPQDPPIAQKVVTGGNPHLLPETARVKYGGVVLEDIGGVKDLSVSVDYFDYRINQVIVTPTVNFLLTAPGMAEFPNAIVRDSSQGNPGPILRIEAVPANNPGAYQVYRGFDYGVKYRVRTVRLGAFTVSADAAQILKTGSDSGLGGGFVNTTGKYYDPRLKVSSDLGWRYGSVGANVNVDWTSHYFNNNYTTAGWGENPYTIVSPQLSYSGWWKSTITVGALNVFNNRPPPNGREPTLFDPNVYGAGALGRFLYVRVHKHF